MTFEEAVEAVRAAYPDRPDLVTTFDGCLRNTLETTVRRRDDGSTFVATGDIPAMWLRDSSAQVETYLRFPSLRDTLLGVVQQQAAYFAIDPYANAFNEHPSEEHFSHDEPPPGPWVWERKYELDSLCYPIRLAYQLKAPPPYEMLRGIVDLMKVEQHHETDSPYRFQRYGDNLPPTETLGRGGKGAETAYTGMVWSGFRPSDDACTYGYLVPANMFAVVSLGQLAELVRGEDAELATEAETLAQQIRAGIEEHAIVEHPTYGRVWAYEVDGRGNHLLMDDANIPSLLSAPYLGFCDVDDPTYRRTRAMVLSAENPYYYVGSAARGIGSPHTHPRWIWPMSLTMQAMTSTDPAERGELIDTLLATTAGTQLMHESFDVDDPARFSRPWFGWANSLFAELILRTI